MNIALILILLTLFLSIFLGIQARRGKDMSLEQWSIGGRTFGTLVVFLLMAGELYTTFTFLGSSGWAYGKGGPTFYVISYAALSYIMSYWLLPAIWRYAKKHNCMSQADFFVSKYKSPKLGVVVSLVAVLAIIPYFILQLKGLGIIVSLASYGSLSPTTAVWIGAISVTSYVMISGIHGSAWTAIVKDILILAVVVFLGIYLPFLYYGGIQPMFEAIDAAKPGFLILPEKGLSESWFISTVLLTSLGFYMWPHAFGSIFSAKEERVFRKNAIVMPLYQLILLFAIFVGFAAILQVPGLKGAEVDKSLLQLSIQTFDPWFVGIIGSAGLLAALVPASMILITASTLLAKNVYHVVFPETSEKGVASAAKFIVPVVSLISVYFTLAGGDTIVTLLLMGYSLVTQLFPALLLSLKENNFVTKQGVFAGIISGVTVVAFVTVNKITLGTMFPSLPQAIQDLNMGIIALFMNFAIMLAISMVTKKSAISTTSNL
ncbi:sodium:solute symporter family protein [Brevibacillus fluminis]|uniref:Sodium:solute symporter family protein n=1 Tax=Brevibacillus fluminis TaxID=511487 RepID=A0A3M8DJU0_9BACL|nr:sodium:solute symporter [Brevibacillus fluminis]RNB87655.1 sodium:solute symporter family protein [Brevibacillus fluminis]